MSQSRRMAWIAIAVVVALSISLLTVWQFTKNATADGHGHSATKPSASSRPVPKAENAKPLRAGEKRLTLQLPATYTPEAPDGVGTDVKVLGFSLVYLQRGIFTSFISKRNGDVGQLVIALNR